MRKIKLTYYLCFLMLFIGITAFSQGRRRPPPRPDPPNRPPGPHFELPIDGGLNYLIIGGILIGAYHIKRKKPAV